ncbi:MAG: FecCD family ABC transporter permease [Desulfomonilia bacterium]
MKHPVIFFLLVLLLASSMALALLTGGTPIPPESIARALFHPRPGDVTTTLVWDLRLPRIVIACVVGAALAQSGVIFQAILRNPLAEPYTLGVSAGGALGATIAIILGIAGFPMVLICFAGAMVSISIVLGIASLRQFSSTMLILSGVVLSFLLSSLVMFIFSVASSRDVHSSIMWLMGDLSSPHSGSLRIMAFMVLPLMAVLVFTGRDLNLLSLGDEKTYHLGGNALQMKGILLVISSLITGGCVAVTGIIGFVGLLVPHLMRKITGADHRLLIPSSMLAGSCFLILCDTFSQFIFRPVELPVGVITGMIGGMFFLFYIAFIRPPEVG